MIRTSDTHPIIVNFVAVPTNPSVKFGMTFCPGKVQQQSLTGNWRRNLQNDLERIKDVYKTRRLVSCIEPHEFLLLEVRDMASVCEKIGLDLSFIPICDGGTPNNKSIAILQSALPTLLNSTEENGFTTIFCKGGLGRTGLIAACLLIECGVEEQHAIEITRVARPGTIENKAQELFIKNYLRTT